MKVSIAINGRIALELTPETDLERMVLAEMRGSADKGQAVQISLAGVDAVVVSVEK